MRELLALTLLLSACRAPEEPAVQLGALLSTSGYVAGIGSDMLRAAALAVDDVNAAGGLLGGQVAIVNENDNTDDEMARQAAQAHVDAGTTALVGGASSASSMAAAEVATPAGVVMVSPYSTSPMLTEFDDDGYLFRTVPSDALGGALMAQRARGHGLERAAVIYAPGAYGEGMAARFEEEFVARGGSLTDKVAYVEGQASYVELLESVLNNDPDMIALPAYPIDAAVLVADYNATFLASHPVMFFFGDGLATEEFIGNVGAGGFSFPHEGLVPHAEGPQFATFASSFERTHGFAPYAYLACAYDAAMVILLAMEASGSTDSTAVRDQLPQVSSGGSLVGPGDVAGALAAARAGEDIDYQGASGEIDFDTYGDVDAPYDLWVVDETGTMVVTASAVDPED
jgi:branched-chain amino acid transport system substrate-binding protein